MSLPTRLAITEWPTQDAPDMYMEQYVTVDHMNGQLIQAAAERDAVQKKLDDTNLQLRNMQPSWDRYDFLRLNLATVGAEVAKLQQAGQWPAESGTAAVVLDQVVDALRPRPAE